MAGYIDLHLHYVPNVDDGVRSLEDGIKVCRELAAIGYTKLVTTPHIRAGMFDNDKAGLTSAFEAFAKTAASLDGMPELALSAEHHCDSQFVDLLRDGGLVPYPGGRALLLEFANDTIPVGIEQLAYKVRLKGMRPLIAHPERYVPVFKRTDPLDRLLEQEVGLQLDLLSLTGKYGRAPRNAAERMLEEGVYLVAASDSHHPDDVRNVGKAIELLIKLVGDEEAEILLAENPRRLLAGEHTL